MNWKLFVPFLLTSIFTIEKVGAALRCGNSDTAASSNSAAYTLLKNVQDKKDLTYKIINYPNKLSSSAIDNIITSAFNAWSAVTDLTFTQVYHSNADITIRFGSYDGKDEGLAYANKYLIHFDEDENWSTKTDSDVINLYAVAVHEIGHTLGLDHSLSVQAIMFAKYNNNNVVWKLSDDDIRVSKYLLSIPFSVAFIKRSIFIFESQGIQHLYGAKTSQGYGNTNGVSVPISVSIPYDLTNFLCMSVNCNL